MEFPRKVRQITMCGHSCLFMGARRHSWTFWHNGGHSWVFVGTSGLLCAFVSIHGHLWAFVGVHGCSQHTSCGRDKDRQGSVCILWRAGPQFPSLGISCAHRRSGLRIFVQCATTKWDARDKQEESSLPPWLAGPTESAFRPEREGCS